MPIKDELLKRKKQIWIVLILLIILIIAAIIYLLLMFFKEPQTIINENINQASIPTPQIITPSTFNVGDSRILADVEALSNVPLTTEEEKQNITFIASSFAERFGSYSNQSNYQNFD